MKNTERLIYKLKETNKFSNKRLARNISILNNSRTFSVNKEGKIMYKSEKKAYRILLRMFPKDIKERIEGLDTSIQAIIDYIERRSGWIYTNKGFIYEDNFKNMHDPEFRSFDTYTIPRNEEGFYLKEDSCNPEYIQSKEKLFYLKYRDKLASLHTFIKEKEYLIKQSIFATEDPELANYLAIYLGYTEDESTIKHNKYRSN